VRVNNKQSARESEGERQGGERERERETRRQGEGEGEGGRARESARAREGGRVYPNGYMAVGYLLFLQEQRKGIIIIIGREGGREGGRDREPCRARKKTERDGS
jgi:hypothetical protein